jgi:hypothetical protein
MVLGNFGSCAIALRRLTLQKPWSDYVKDTMVIAPRRLRLRKKRGPTWLHNTII